MMVARVVLVLLIPMDGICGGSATNLKSHNPKMKFYASLLKILVLSLRLIQADCLA